MKIATRESLQQQAEQRAKPELVADAFGSAGGAYVRGYTWAELSRWRETATGPDNQIDADLLQRLQLAAVVLGEDEQPLFSHPEHGPSQEDLAAIATLPAGAVAKLIRASDARSGFGEEAGKPGEVPTPGEKPGSGSSTAAGASGGKSKSRRAKSGTSS